MFDGGTKLQRGTVIAALEASSFDWSVVPGPIAIHIALDIPVFYGKVCLGV